MRSLAAHRISLGGFCMRVVSLLLQGKSHYRLRIGYEKKKQEYLLRIKDTSIYAFCIPYLRLRDTISQVQIFLLIKCFMNSYFSNLFLCLICSFFENANFRKNLQMEKNFPFLGFTSIHFDTTFLSNYPEKTSIDITSLILAKKN